MNNLYLFSIVFSLLPGSLCYDPTYPHRNITTVTAPGCVDTKLYSCDVKMYYVKAVGENDTIHYLWDFTNKPSLLLVYSGLQSSIFINWDKYMANESNSIHFEPQPDYSFMVILDKIVEFDDKNDTGFISDNSKNVSYNLNNFTWKVTKDIASDNDLDVTTELTGTNFNDGTNFLSGSISFQLSAYGIQDHDIILPRLFHSANSSQGRLELRNLASHSNISNARWAVELVLISSDLRNETFYVDMKNNIDDEHSPGVFSVYNVVSPGTESENGHGAYLQWRKVVYTAAIPSLGNSSDVAVMRPMNISNPKSVLSHTLADKYFGRNLKKHLVQRTIVSFGTSQDGFYKKTNFTSWSFLMGYGSPQSEGLSMLIVLVMAIGLGLPAMLILGGGIFLCARRLANRSDELSLQR